MKSFINFNLTWILNRLPKFHANKNEVVTVLIDTVISFINTQIVHLSVKHAK